MPPVELPELHEGRSGQRELFKLTNAIRAQVNLLPTVYSAQVITVGDGVATMIWGLPVGEGTAIKLTASVLGCTNDLSEQCAFTLECAIVNPTGTVAFTGGTQQVTFVRETVGGTNAEFVISGEAILLNVTDAAAQKTFWRATIYAEQLGG